MTSNRPSTQRAGDTDVTPALTPGSAGNSALQPTALVVDDDMVLRVSIGRFVENQGFATRLCADGGEAVASLRSQPADIVLMDAQMPEMDGFDACAAIRALPEGERVPIIMITANEDKASVDRAFAVGANEYITKPVHWAVLGHRLHQLVAAARAEQALRDDRAFLQSLVDAIPDPTLVCDTDGVVVWVNRAVQVACRMCDVRVGDRLRFYSSVRDAGRDGSAGDALVASLLASAVTVGRSEQHLLIRQEDNVPPLFAELHVRPLFGAAGASRGMILRVQDVTERELEGRRLRSQVSHFDKLAHHDALTGLANRRLFLRRLEEALTDARNRSTMVAVMFLDLDGFKRINDTYGHEVGDLVLRTIAGRLRAHVRRSDSVARFGGDEFAVLLTDCPSRELVAEIGQDLLGAVAAPLPADISRHPVSGSIGVALYPSHADNGAKLMRCADSSMYHVKSSGKGALKFYDECGHGAVDGSCN